MRTRFDRKFAVVAAIAMSSVALFAGCGSNNNAPPVAPIAPGVGIGGGCAPIMTTNMIGFQANNMFLGSPQMGDTRVLAGIIPPGDKMAQGTYGTVMVTGGNVVPPAPTQFGVPMSFQTRRVDGTSMNLSVTSATNVVPPNTQYYPQVGAYGSPYGGGPYNYPYPASGQVNGTGYIQISSMIQQLLIQTAMGTGGMGQFGGMFGYPGGYPATYPQQPNASQICVSGLAFSLQRTNPSFANWLYLGNVYFYLSGGVMNGQHGLAVYF